MKDEQHSAFLVPTHQVCRHIPWSTDHCRECWSYRWRCSDTHGADKGSPADSSPRHILHHICKDTNKVAG